MPDDEFDPTAYVSPAEAGRRLGVSGQTVRRWIAEDRLAGVVVTVTGRKLIPLSTLAEVVPHPARRRNANDEE